MSRPVQRSSDVDLAFASLPTGMTEFQLTAEFEERLGRPVDVVDLARSRLRLEVG